MRRCGMHIPSGPTSVEWSPAAASRRPGLTDYHGAHSTSDAVPRPPIDIPMLAMSPRVGRTIALRAHNSAFRDPALVLVTLTREAGCPPEKAPSGGSCAVGHRPSWGGASKRGVYPTTGYQWERACRAATTKEEAFDRNRETWTCERSATTVTGGRRHASNFSRGASLAQPLRIQHDLGPRHLGKGDGRAVGHAPDADHHDVAGEQVASHHPPAGLLPHRSAEQLG
jgi:hypothetical protein